MILELTEEEIIALKIFMSKVAGCPSTSIRKYADSIFKKLDGLNIKYLKSEEQKVYVSSSSSIYCLSDTLHSFNKLVLPMKPVSEMTMEQVCEALGKNVKIVKG